MAAEKNSLVPPLAPVHLEFDAPKISDIPAEVRSRIAESGVTFRSGERIAICCGSRGIANQQTVVRTLVEELRAAGAEPFLIPAMGSHGGATDEGQAEVLASYGLDEAGVGAPVRSSMKTVQLDQGELPHPLYMDAYAHEADGIILVNRIKPHTDFHGPIESGLLKMAVIGLGKQDQAETMHNYGVHGLRDLITPAAREVLATGKIRMGLGLVENARDETMLVRAIPPDSLEETEMELLEVARESMPRLPLDDIDVLVIDEIGKDISGCGLDSNIIGRIRIAGEAEPETPRIRRIVCTDLTPASHGNSIGMGLADFMTRRLYDKMEPAPTNANVFTSTFIERGMMPPVLETAGDAIEWALRTANLQDMKQARVVRIRNTLKLEDMWVSEPAWNAIVDSQAAGSQAGAGSDTGAAPAVERTGEFESPLDPSGELRPFDRGE